MAQGPRGEVIETALGHNLPRSFRVIDRFESGVVTSIKSVDLDRASYLSGSTLSSTLTRYVDGVAAFNGASRANVRIQPNQISSRALEIVVPHDGTAAQQAVLTAIRKYGASKGVSVTILTFP
jgi:filamentous hemagglutinin